MEEIKKWQATHIAPLQPPILAAFRPWGGSAGAGRVRPAGANISELKFFLRSNSIKNHRVFEKLNLMLKNQLIHPPGYQMNDNKPRPGKNFLYPNSFLP